MVFSKDNFYPAGPSDGWDGTFNSERLNPAVFVFIIEVEFIDGRVEIIKGDISLIR